MVVSLTSAHLLRERNDCDVLTRQRIGALNIQPEVNDHAQERENRRRDHRPAAACPLGRAGGREYPGRLLGLPAARLQEPASALRVRQPRQLRVGMGLRLTPPPYPTSAFKTLSACL